MEVELYKVLYDYDAQRNDELSLKGGDQVRLIEQENEEWCTAENVETGQQGAVPMNFLEKVPSRSRLSTDTNGPLLAKVSQDYTAQDVEELSLWKNGIVTVLDQSTADGWWKGDLNGKSGIFPSDHVDIIDASQEQTSGPDENDKTKRQSFKLAAYGVKQGGIGSILAGGFNLRKKGSKKETPPHQVSAAEQSDDSKTNVNTFQSNAKPIEANRREKAIVVSAYTPQNEDELQLLPGAYVTIIDGLDDEDWWRGVNEKGEEGVFPSNFVQILSDQDIPSRPVRARPPTIQTDSQSTPPSVRSPTSMAKPPPVPVGNRRSSLSTRRATVTDYENASETPAPAPRPRTLPPVPSRRTNSISSYQPSHNHKRTPSIPLVSPDLPPPRQEQQQHQQHFGKTSAHIISPGSTDTGSSNVTPTSPVSAGLAKVPKTFGKHPSEPISAMQGFVGDDNSSSANPVPPPRAPKRSIPSVPARSNMNEDGYYQHSRDLSNGSITSNTTTSNKSVSSPNLSITTSPTTIVPPKRNTDTFLNNNELYSTDDPLEKKLRQWFKEEAQTIRQEFESRLEKERCHRRRLEEELESLKQQLS
ncbi:SH3 domain-containing protein [Absidia repens]|uniref:SH3 domain-containing protein n=1 Tax=Absidia repens TaxID=90262 RepID=A0A1X2IM22_9FUNG|nr:SH3 domain-containing protein [Absidia repens]